MTRTMNVWGKAFAATVLLLASTLSVAQELPLSGVTGLDAVYATSPSGVSRLLGVKVHASQATVQFGADVNAVPSRWSHRRRTMGALETEIASPVRGLYMTPMGNAVGNGAIHMVDLRAGLQTALVPIGNPAGYDLGVVKRTKFIFSASDDGAGNTLVRGYSYSTPGALTPLTPPTRTVSGSPSAYVNRMGIDEVALELHIPTSTGIQVMFLSATAPHWTPGPFLSTGTAAPATNPARFNRNGQTSWVVGTSTFSAINPPTPAAAGFFSWDSSGNVGSGVFGSVPTQPSKNWVAAAGAEELAIVGNGVDTYVYYLLREPPPGTFFVKPAAVGVVRYLGSAAPLVSTILMPADVGEPFANPAVFGTRVAFEGSFGAPFINIPPGGGEKIAIIYTPLDPLGAPSVAGVLGDPNPLGGRVSTKGMDRPIWSVDGTRVFAATSHFPGAPNPGVAGLEVLDVPADIVLDSFQGPHTVVVNNPFPNQSIILPSLFKPRLPGVAGILAGISFYGNVFHQGVASLAGPAHGEIGQIQLDPNGFTQSPAIPDFRAILPPSFNDATASLIPIPGSFGARRTSFNFAPGLGVNGLTMAAAMDDELLFQMTGVNFMAALGLGTPVDTVHVALPSGWITTTEIVSQ